MHRLRLALFAWTAVACLTAGAQQIAFTFDDLPSHGPLPPGETRLSVAQSILKTLKAEHMPPVYGFVNGVRTEQEPGSDAVLSAWHAAGEPLGNHTWAHTSLNTQTPEQFMADVERNETLIRRFDPTGDIKWLRYPNLHEGDTLDKRRAVRSALAAKGYRIAEVTMSFGDYLWNAPYARCSAKGDAAAVQQLHDSYLQAAKQSLQDDRALTQQVFGRDIPYVLLMHIGAFDAKMLPELLTLYRGEGVKFISLPDALNDPAYSTDPDVPGGGTFTGMLARSKHLEPGPRGAPSLDLQNLCK